MEFLKSEGFSPSVISAHRLCYKELVEFFSASGQVYSSEAVRGKMNLPSHGKEFLHPTVSTFLHASVSSF